jgi:hypothetical protein
MSIILLERGHSCPQVQKKISNHTRTKFPRSIHLLLLLLSAFGMFAQEILDTEICVYGGTAGGVIAVIEAARLSKKTVLLEFGNHLGGMTSGGLGQTDIGNKGAIGGISREFYRRVGAKYGKDETWTFEPHVAERVLFEMINEAKVPVYFQSRLAGVHKNGARIESITMEDGRVIRAKVFIDATYEGDLMAMAGVSYTVGREGNSKYDETLNGVRGVTPKHQFLVPIDPYTVPGKHESGLIPLIQFGDGGVPGEGDKAVQAYNFRLVLTRDPMNQRPITPPADYSSARFELLARYLEGWDASTNRRPSLGDLMHIQMMPNGKTDINNNGGFSTDFIGANYDYPDADYAQRALIWKEHENYTRAFLHFLASDARVPENIRLEMRSWGLTRDEFLDTRGWPHQLYIREARRMISDYVMTERNCRESLELPDGIALAAYTMDSHNCQRLVKDGHAANEGDVQVGGFPPYQIAFRSLVPKQTECDNLLVPICLSASHIAYGSIRMEPVFMVLGHSAAAAAAISIRENLPIQQLDISELRKQLLAEKQILVWKKG